MAKLISQLLCFSLMIAHSVVAADTMESVQGNGCYSYSDEETPRQGEQKAMIQARRNAVESYRVFVKSTSTVKNFQLEEDIIWEVSSGMLSHITIENREENGRKVCLTISAHIDPKPMEALIDQHIKAKRIVDQVQATPAITHSDFGLRIWTNNPADHYFEGENLVIFIQSERDGYLQLDYFQADGNVIHLVPNMFRGQAHIERGKTYSFGGLDSPESFVITGPFGHEIINAMVSPHPIAEQFKPDSPITESQKYLKTFKSRLRGIQIQANASVHLSTMSKSAQEHKSFIQEK